jgi:hypothetical protein
MKVLDVQVFYPGITLDQCYALHCSEHYQNKVAEAADTTRHLVSSTPLPHGGLKRQARFAYTRPIEGHAVRSLLQTLTPQGGHLEDSTYENARGGTWSIVGGVSLFPECVSGQGTLRFSQAPNGVWRHVNGQLSCSLLGLGKLIEPQIVSRVEESLRAAAGYTPAYLRTYGIHHRGAGAAHGARLGVMAGSLPEN